MRAHAHKRTRAHSHARALLARAAAPLPPPYREVPASFDARQRSEFLEISKRVKEELCASFTLVAGGLQMYQAQATQAWNTS